MLDSGVMSLHGCGTALVTPFLPDGSIDTDALAALVERQVDAGIDFLVACGTTAETPTLSEAECLDVIRIVAAVANRRVPVVAGCTHNATREAVSRAQAAGAVAGVDALLTANPPYNKPSQEGQFQHFRAVAESVSLPVMLYNIPSRSGSNLLPATAVRLAQACPNIRAVKESSGNLQQITELVHLAPEGLEVFAGDDNLALPAIAVGAAGLVSVASNEIPREMTRMVSAALRDNWEDARRINSQWYGLMLANFSEPSPGPVKHVMARMGLLQQVYRLPMVPPSEEAQARLDSLIEQLGLLTPASAGWGAHG